jgi:hypothetical protein
MRLVPALVFLAVSGLACAQSAPNPSNVEGSPQTPSIVPLPTDSSPMPKGNPSVIGGTVASLDRVRDQLVVRVFGSKQTLRILFDERTQVFRDGKPIPVRELRPADHVSLETVADRTGIFAKSIHVRSTATEAECRGQILKYDPAKGELTVRDMLTPQPVTLTLGSRTTFVGEDQSTTASAAALKPGALVAATFSADGPGRRVAHQVTILAAPGSAFTFAGTVAYLDLSSGLLVVTDPRDKKTYEISFEPRRFPTSSQLRQGSDVTITADFNGTRYVARDIAVNSSRE